MPETRRPESPDIRLRNRAVQAGLYSDYPDEGFDDVEALSPEQLRQAIDAALSKGSIFYDNAGRPAARRRLRARRARPHGRGRDPGRTVRGRAAGRGRRRGARGAGAQGGRPGAGDRRGVAGRLAAGPAFVAGLIAEGYHRAPHVLRQQVLRAAQRLAGPSVDGAGIQDSARKRAAVPFALLLTAGEVAKEFGLVPEAADVGGAVAWAWGRFLASSDAVALDPEQQAIDSLRTWLAERWDVTVRER